MNLIPRWNLFRELQELHDRLSDLFDRTSPPPHEPKAIVVTTWSPHADTSANDPDTAAAALVVNEHDGG